MGADWCLARDGAHEWLVRTAAVSRVAGLADRAVDERHRSLASRLGFGSALRGVAEEGLPVLVQLRDGAVLRGTVHRVGADFVEVRSEGDGFGPGAGWPVEAVTFVAVAAVRRT